MFRSATFQLTMGYLSLVMAISFIFSGVVYHVGTAELQRGLRHQTERIYNDFPVFDNDSFVQPVQDLRLGAHRLLAQLILFNTVVLVGAGLASYYLARRTLEPIEAAHAKQTRFTADVSHEMRTPLTALKMEAEVALMDSAASKAALRSALKSNIEEADKLDMLINSLLRLSRLEAGEVRTSFSSVEVAEIVKAAVKQANKAAEQKEIKLEVGPVDGELQGDREGLVQLLTILLDNAIKYSPKKATVYVQSKQENGHTTITVRDEGIGIEPEALNHVFDRFYRADSSRNKADTEGFGLGLSIAKMIADIHDGTIRLSSRLGKGTTATVTLPAASNNAA